MEGSSTTGEGSSTSLLKLAYHIHQISPRMGGFNTAIILFYYTCQQILLTNHFLGIVQHSVLILRISIFSSLC